MELLNIKLIAVLVIFFFFLVKYSELTEWY